MAMCIDFSRFVEFIVATEHVVCSGIIYLEENFIEKTASFYVVGDSIYHYRVGFLMASYDAP